MPVLFSALNNRAEAAAGLSMSVLNQTGKFANSAIKMYIVGTELSTGRQGFVKSPGVFTPAALSDNGPDGFADLSVPLAAGTAATSFALPKMSGRVYFSINGQLKFKVVADGNGKPALQYPAAWVSADPSFNVLHDCWEFTYSDAGMFCNTTNVDMFSVPMAIKLTGARTQSTGALVDGGRDKIFAAMRAEPTFNRLVIGDNLRIISPGHGIGAGLFPANYYDAYINEVWAKYATTDLKITTNRGTFTGRVNGGRLTFDGGVASFGKPTTTDVLFCDGALVSPNDGVTGPVGAVLGAGFNRSTLVSHPNQPTTDPSTFYKAPISNHFSRILHANHADGKSYGFAYDDVVDFASYIQDERPASIEVRLTPFGAGNPNPGPTAAPTGSPIIVVPPPTTSSPTGGATRSAYARIEAESFVAQGGTQTENCSEGGRNVAYVSNGDWISLGRIDFGTAPAKQFQIRAASGAGAGVSGLVEVRLDSRNAAPVGTLAIGNTGGWQSWRTVPGGLANTTGVHEVFLTFTSGQPADFVNVNWVQFGK
ncbi:beta-1,3-glucanase family protein [Virgisporangium aliadipatigenens]|uniref:beta-1,3-glucanase family protein n=1 Tax=Virgisporangium aliadipatigenens TaxID=741659 RepID=UPI001EF25ABD|nr:beta-1,3-glucanase family protein [Virgisporangium aliadipatigenens]